MSVGYETSLAERGVCQKTTYDWDFETPRWLALYTKSRHEKLTCRELSKKGVETFLPLRKIQRQWSDRKKIIEEPLFRGYLFVKIPLKEKNDVLNATGAVSFVSHSENGPIPIPEKDIQRIYQFIERDIAVDPFPYLKEGQRVYVRSGPLQGTEGFILRKDEHCRLVISLDLLMQSISLVIDEACVEPI